MKELLEPVEAAVWSVDKVRRTVIVPAGRYMGYDTYIPKHTGEYVVNLVAENGTMYEGLIYIIPRNVACPSTPLRIALSRSANV